MDQSIEHEQVKLLLIFYCFTSSFLPKKITIFLYFLCGHFINLKSKLFHIPAWLMVGEWNCSSLPNSIMFAPVGSWMTIFCKVMFTHKSAESVQNTNRFSQHNSFTADRHKMTSLYYLKLYVFCHIIFTFLK
jgi:hypothetical protein